MAKRIGLTKAQKKLMAEMGRIGGETRAKNLSPEKRRAIAITASKAAAAARKKRAKERREL